MRFLRFIIYAAFSALLVLSACLAVAWWRKSPDNAGKGRERNGKTTMTADVKAASKLRMESISSAYRVVAKSARTNKSAENVQPEPQSFPLTAESTIHEFTERQTNSLASDAAQAASDMNDVMDEMLNRSEIPADYAETMVALFRDKSQGDVIRDFAVQHIGLYAETLQMRGKYDADSAESATLRDALWNAAEETRTIVAAAAFRALADMSAFDRHVDSRRLDAKLVSCVADASAAPAARVMAAQLCGERRIAASFAALSAIVADKTQPLPLRLAAKQALR